MSQTGVISFVTGIDLTKYNFEDDYKQPKTLSDMQRLKWLKLNRTRAHKLPNDICTLKTLVNLN